MQGQENPQEDPSADVEIPRAPGYWISCTSGRWLNGGRNPSPFGWLPPEKAEGVRWGVRLTVAGAVQVAHAAAGENLSWQPQGWFHQPDVIADISDLVPAVLVQPHQRTDGSQAKLFMEVLQ